MAEQPRPAREAVIEAPNLLREPDPRRDRKGGSWLIAAPGQRVLTPLSQLAAGAGGFLAGTVIAVLFRLSMKDWPLLAVLLLTTGLGLAYARVFNRYFANERLVADGKAVRISDTDRNDLVVQAVRRNAPAYYSAAQRAAELDDLAFKLADQRLDQATRTVRETELAEGTDELRMTLSRASLTHAEALLDPSDPAIRAAGRITAAIYAELYEGRAAAYDEDN